VAPDTTIGDGAYVGPYTSVGPNSTLANVHIENSVIIGDSTVTASERIVDSLLILEAVTN